MLISFDRFYLYQTGLLYQILYLSINNKSITMYKEVRTSVEGHSFTIYYPIEIKDYQLDKSKGKIAIGISYYPTTQISATQAESNFLKSLQALHQEVVKIINSNNDFYKDFIADDYFKGRLAHCYPYFGREMAISNHTELYLTKKGS